MRTPLVFLALSLTLAACTTTPPPAPSGGTAYGLSSGSVNTLVTFGLGNAATSATSQAITGLPNSETLVDLDVNPANGTLYGFTSTGKAYTIDPSSGAATLNAAAGIAVKLSVADFNPAANRVRVIDNSTAPDGNYRLTVVPGPSTSPAGTVTSDGTVVYSDATTGTPNLLGSAYTNSYLNNGTPAPSASLYSVDGNSNSLVLHNTGPAFNNVARVGALGITLSGNVGFDIYTQGGLGGPNMGYLSDGNALYWVNLNSGAATKLSDIGLSIKGLAVAQTYY